MNADSSTQQKIEAVLEAASQEDNPQMSPRLRAALRDIADLSDETQEQARATLAKKLEEIPSAIGAGFVAVLMGAAVERGMPAEVSCESIRRVLDKWCRTLITEPEGSEYADSPADEKVVEGLQLLGQALVAHLSRAKDALDVARRDEAFVSELKRVTHLSYGALWVLELITKRSGEMIVLHVASRSGFRVSYRNFSNCFHLFTLLQAALSEMVPDGKAVDKNLLALARGEIGEKAGDEAWWHYGKADCPRRELAGSIWGEGSPDEIPRVAGEQVILLWPSLLERRGWDAGYFSPFLQAAPPSVEIVGPLTSEEMTHWWNVLRLEDAEGPEDHELVVCPACLHNNPATGDFCNNCGDPLSATAFNMPHSRPLAQGAVMRRSIEASGLNCLGLVAMPLLIVFSLISALVASMEHKTAEDRWGFGLAAVGFGVLCWLANKYCKKK